jgi:hypothetical protein
MAHETSSYAKCGAKLFQLQQKKVDAINVTFLLLTFDRLQRVSKTDD